jgi:aminopeptidase
VQSSFWFCYMDAALAAQNALQYVLLAKVGERITIFCDDSRKLVGEAFERGAELLELRPKLVILETHSSVIRKEIPTALTKYLTSERADIYINLLSGNREETPFRIKLIHSETSEKSRLGHCPGVTLDMLTEGALAMTPKEHLKMQKFATRFMKKLKSVDKFQITTAGGTNLSVSMRGRQFISDVLFNRETMNWLNLPTGEVYGGAVEDSLEGEFVCDLAIGGIGPIATNVEIQVKDGKAVEIISADAEVLKRVKDSLHFDAMSNVVGEFAFGINPKARLVQEFLETEKLYGTVHFAFGDNTDMPGGKNNSANHMDMLINKPTVNAVKDDGSITPLLVDGVFQKFTRESK